ncbi:hypothetical protein F5X96DRAFT_476808 [Biscogniauxia mediterranea]|nr:hypothetical protein F5X96DRAFT_476808 [Biscogniauxia mediterranea]
MEAVGAVATIVGIATFGLELAKKLKTYVSIVVDANDILRDLRIEVKATAKIIEQLNNFVKEDNADSARTRTRVLSEEGQNDILQLTSRCSAVYKKLAKEIGIPQDGAAPSYGRKFKLPFQEATIKKYREELVFLKLDLLLHINIFQWGQERIMHPDKSDVLLEQVTNLFLQMKKDFINDIITRRNRIEQRQSQTNQPVATIDHNGPNEGHHQVAGPHLNYLSRPTTASNHSMRDERQVPLNDETASRSFAIPNNSTLQPNKDSSAEIQKPNTGSPNVPPMTSALSPHNVPSPNDTFQESPH